MSLPRKALPAVLYNVDTSTRSHGLSERMISTHLSGLDWYDKHAETSNETSLKELTIEYLGGDNACELIVHYMVRLAKSKL